MPTTRKKVIKTVYKNEEESEGEGGDFSDSGSEAEIPEAGSSDDDEQVELSSSEEFKEETKTKKKTTTTSRKPKPKPKFAKALINKINKQHFADCNEDLAATLFTVKDLSEADKLLPSVLNLSESDSSDDESMKQTNFKSKTTVPTTILKQNPDSDDEKQTIEYKDVFSNNIQDNSEEIAKRTYMELAKHKNEIEQTKLSVQKYSMQTKASISKETSINDLLAQGEDEIMEIESKPKKKSRRKVDDSDSDIGDWEEVNEVKGIPQQGLQLIVDFPDATRKKKIVDAEMMMRRRINRVKKEYQVYMHKVHVLCWLGHGNYVSRVLNDQEVMTACLTLVPSQECYPGERVDMKYVEQITAWYKDKLTLKQDRHENKFKPKAPPLKTILLNQIKSKTVTTKKNLVLIFVTMLRALGLQCRIMFNFVTLPIKPPSSELCSLSTKEKNKDEEKNCETDTNKGKTKSKAKAKKGIPQLDGTFDNTTTDDSDFENILQLDGNNDPVSNTRATRSNKNKVQENTTTEATKEVLPQKRGRKNVVPKLKISDKAQDDVSPPKRSRTQRNNEKGNQDTDKNTEKVSSLSTHRRKKSTPKANKTKSKDLKEEKSEEDIAPPKRIRKSPSPSGKPIKEATSSKILDKKSSSSSKNTLTENPKESVETKNVGMVKKLETNKYDQPKIIVTKAESTSSKYFADGKSPQKQSNVRTRSKTTNHNSLTTQTSKVKTISAPGTSVKKSKYFAQSTKETNKKTFKEEDKLRISHRDLAKTKTRNNVTGDLVKIIKTRVKEAKEESKIGLVKGKNINQESDDDSDFLPEESIKPEAESDDDFKPAKVTPKSKSPRTSTSRKVDRRVLSTDDESKVTNKCDVWCEIYVEELEQWIAIDVIKAKVHCVNEIYNRTTHPVCYIVGWDNNNYLKDLTRRYVPHWNTVTRKLRTDHAWWQKAVQPWLGPKTARDKEEDEGLDRMQLEAPLPTTISEYKNHPLYALKRHLLKYEALYPPDAATLGFVRNEPVYSRDCVYTCRSRDTWLKEAKVVRLGERPYKIVKARPKWDKLSNKCITDKPLDVFGPWQVDDYEPPEAKDGVVPRNAYGNVELFKECMLPKGTVHLRLPGLNKVARNLHIDCAPAMTGFDFNGGWSHPVYDGFVVCKEFEEIITEAWLKDQEDQERKEREKIEARVYGNWKKLIRGLFIRERLNEKYGFENPTEPEPKMKSKGPRLVVKKT